MDFYWVSLVCVVISLLRVYDGRRVAPLFSNMKIARVNKYGKLMACIALSAAGNLKYAFGQGREMAHQILVAQ
jgi:hypothetical protein